MQAARETRTLYAPSMTPGTRRWRHVWGITVVLAAVALLMVAYWEEPFGSLVVWMLTTSVVTVCWAACAEPGECRRSVDEKTVHSTP